MVNAAARLGVVGAFAVLAWLPLGCGASAPPAGGMGGMGGMSETDGSAGSDVVTRSSDTATARDARPGNIDAAPGAEDAEGEDTGGVDIVARMDTRGPDTAGPDTVGSDAGPIAGDITPAGSRCVPGQNYGSPFLANRTPALIKGGYGTAEGPTWVVAQRALYFSDIHGRGTDSNIFKYTLADGMIRLFVGNLGVNGLSADPMGKIVAASFDMQRVTRFDPATGERTQILGGDMYMGKPFNCINDVVVRGDGNIYMSDPDFQQAGRPGQDATAFYRLSPEGIVTRIATAQGPNGIALSPDGRFLYVAGTAPVRRFPLGQDGAVTGPGTDFAATGSDGMGVDCAGNVYVTTQGLVRVYSPGGQMLGNITGFQGTTNVAFGGDDMKTLFVTGGGALYQLRMNVPGLPN
jgi:gluconolactonase